VLLPVDEQLPASTIAIIEHVVAVHEGRGDRPIGAIHSQLQGYQQEPYHPSVVGHQRHRVIDSVVDASVVGVLQVGLEFGERVPRNG
jgi:hypothetical protein